MELGFGKNKDVKVVIIRKGNNEVRLNFENFAELLGLYSILETVNTQSVFTKNLKLIKKEDDYIIVRKSQTNSFKIRLSKDDFLNLIKKTSEIYKYFASEVNR